MACCLMAASHYLNQCWLIISTGQWHTSEANFIERYPSHKSLKLASKYHPNLPGANKQPSRVQDDGYIKIMLHNLHTTLTHHNSDSIHNTSRKAFRMKITKCCKIFSKISMPKFSIGQIDLNGHHIKVGQKYPTNRFVCKLQTNLNLIIISIPWTCMSYPSVEQNSADIIWYPGPFFAIATMPSILWDSVWLSNIADTHASSFNSYGLNYHLNSLAPERFDQNFR